MVSKLIEKLFLSAHYFTIALRRRAEADILEDTCFQSEFIMPATLRDWAADPVLVDYQGKTFLFYEAVKGEKGRIEVAEVRDDCTLSKGVVILEDEYHYSYPFIFRHEDVWYMIPESSSRQEVALYQAVDFPWMWEKKQILLSGFRAVDTTVFFRDGDWYLLTYLPADKTEHVTPRAYQLHLSGEPRLTEIPWPEYDPLEVRGAGPVFTVGGRQYRPGQVSEPNCYGNALTFYEITSVMPEYHEVQRARLTPAQLIMPRVICDGLHTYAVSERFEAIDIRCRKVVFLKVFRKIIHKFKRP